MRILVSAGPTREALDPVRFLTNRSTGKMGYAIAEAGLDAGHDVTLVTGPVALQPPAGAAVIAVETAQEMFEAVRNEAPAIDVFIMTAAVADLRPANPSRSKLKKRELPRNEAGRVVLELEPTPDILASLPDWRSPRSLTIGFAAETTDHQKHALAKLTEKRCDLILLNDVSRRDIGFGADENEVHLLYPDGRIEPWLRMTKKDVGRKLIQTAETLWNAKAGAL